VALASTSVQWRDLTFATGEAATYRITSLEGWAGRSAPRYDKQNRARAHGSHPSPVYADERIVTVEGRSWSQDDRDAVLLALEQRMTFDGGEEPLTITLAGRELTAFAQFLRCDPILTPNEWGIGRFGWIAQWRCPDPLRYGPVQSAVSTGLPTAGGGLVYPLTYPLSYGSAGTPGQVTLTNDGTAAAPIVFTVTGSLPAGFEVSASGQRLVYPVPVPAGETLTVDTAAGTILAQGTADRRGNLTVADWITVPPLSSITLQFTSLGGAYDPAAQLTVPGFRSASW